MVRFNYLTLHLRKQNWLHFIKIDNPVSAALLSKMGYSEKERVLVKLELFKILARLKFDMEKEKLLVGFFESYLKLTEEEEEIFMEEARKLENADEVLEITVSYEEKGKEKGRKQGVKEGMQKGLQEGFQKGLQGGKKEVATRMLEENFPIEKIVYKCQDKNVQF